MDGEGLPMKGEIMIGNEFAGAILGRRGQNIQGIRDRSGAQVHLQGSQDGQTRHVEIQGTEFQVMEAHRLVNQILHREYPNAFLRGFMVPMKATIDLKMSIELATYLTGMNRTTLSEIQSTTATAITLHDVDEEEGFKWVRLQGSFDQIREAYKAVMIVLDTYETFVAANQSCGVQANDESGQPTAAATTEVPTVLPVSSGTMLQMSTAWVVQQDGSCTEMQIYIPTTPVTSAPLTATPTAVQGPDAAMAEEGLYSAQSRTRYVHYPLGVEARATNQPTRVLHTATVTRREPQTVYTPLTQALAPPSVQQSQGVLFPDATASVYYPPSFLPPR